MLFIICKLLTKIQASMKNWLWAACGFSLHRKENFDQITHKQLNNVHLKQHLPIFKKYPTLRDELVTMLQKMRSVGQPLSTSVVQPILTSMIESFSPKILCNGHGGFVVTREWTRHFLKHYMNWSFHMATTIVNKMPTNWHEQGRDMVYIIAYLTILIQFLHALWLTISKL
jgi:hypothetical protein